MPDVIILKEGCKKTKTNKQTWEGGGEEGEGERR